MKKSITSSLFVVALCLTLFVGKTNAQALIYGQNFDTVSTTNGPTGWVEKAYSGNPDSTSTTLVDSISLNMADQNGWYIDATGSNASDGTGSATVDAGDYPHPSGAANMVIHDQSNAGDPEVVGGIGKFDLITCSISTLEYKDITLSYGVRNSKNFGYPTVSVDGNTSYIDLFGSIDGGTNWISIPYTESPSSSEWLLIDYNSNSDASTPITLPGTFDHQPSVKFKWTALINALADPADGTYRFDDFMVAGTLDSISAPAGITEIGTKPSTRVYLSSNSSTINIVANEMGNENYTVEVLNVLGEVIDNGIMTSATMQINAGTLSNGIYLVRVSNGSASQVTKIALSR